MLQKTKDQISGALERVATKYGNAQLKRYTDSIIGVYEENETDSSKVLGRKLAQAVSDTHLIGFQPHQEDEQIEYWKYVVEEIRNE